MNCTVAIVGGGLFGSGLALELVRKGIAVTLIDRDVVPVNRAARRNEGKVHLGFVYAQEDDARTAAVMLEGALAFRRIVASWIGNEAWRSIPSSTPYHYLIHRDSILDATRLALHYAAVQRLYEETAAADPQVLDYLGDRPPSLWRPLDPAEVSAYRRASVQSGFATVERAIDTDSLCDQLAAVVSATPAIRWVGGTHVEGVTNRGKGFEVYGDRMGDRWAERFDFVVNAAWTSRVAIDRSVGIVPPKGHLLRLKYRVIVSLPNHLRGLSSATIVLGRFGDVVIRGDGTGCLSWYPACLRGWSDAAEPPAEWEDACRGEPATVDADAVAHATLAAFEPYYPGMSRAAVLAVDAGGIVARGSSDIDDPGSRLHSRHAIGILHTVEKGYLSVDQGKWTTAPLFAARVGEMVAQMAGVGNN